MIWLKATHRDGSPSNGGFGLWARPSEREDGRWRPGQRWSAGSNPVQGPLDPCSNGLHICKPKDLRTWVAEAVWLVQPYGEILASTNKSVVRDARLLCPLPCWSLVGLEELAAGLPENEATAQLRTDLDYLAYDFTVDGTAGLEWRAVPEFGLPRRFMSKIQRAVNGIDGNTKHFTAWVTKSARAALRTVARPTPRRVANGKAKAAR